MKKQAGKFRVIGIALATAIAAAACGGGDGDVPVSVPQTDVVVMMKEIRVAGPPYPGMPEFDEVRIDILDIRCASLSPVTISGLETSNAPTVVILLDVYARDVEKLKSFGFSVFGPSEQARKSAALCY